MNMGLSNAGSALVTGSFGLSAIRCDLPAEKPSVDPFVRIFLNKDLVWKSHKLDNNKSPKWDLLDVVYFFLNVPLATSSLKFRIFDHRPIIPSRRFGKFKLPLSYRFFHYPSDEEVGPFVLLHKDKDTLGRAFLKAWIDCPEILHHELKADNSQEVVEHALHNMIEISRRDPYIERKKLYLSQAILPEFMRLVNDARYRVQAVTCILQVARFFPMVNLAQEIQNLFFQPDTSRQLLSDLCDNHPQDEIILEQSNIVHELLNYVYNLYNHPVEGGFTDTYSKVDRGLLMLQLAVLARVPVLPEMLNDSQYVPLALLENTPAYVLQQIIAKPNFLYVLARHYLMLYNLNEKPVDAMMELRLLSCLVLRILNANPELSRCEINMVSEVFSAMLTTQMPEEHARLAIYVYQKMRNANFELNMDILLSNIHVKHPDIRIIQYNISSLNMRAAGPPSIPVQGALPTPNDNVTILESFLPTEDDPDCYVDYMTPYTPTPSADNVVAFMLEDAQQLPVTLTHVVLKHPPVLSSPTSMVLVYGAQRPVDVNAIIRAVQTQGLDGYRFYETPVPNAEPIAMLDASAGADIKQYTEVTIRNPRSYRYTIVLLTKSGFKTAITSFEGRTYQFQYLGFVGVVNTHGPVPAFDPTGISISPFIAQPDTSIDDTMVSYPDETMGFEEMHSSLSQAAGPSFVQIDNTFMTYLYTNGQYMPYYHNYSYRKHVLIEYDDETGNASNVNEKSQFYDSFFGSGRRGHFTPRRYYYGHRYGFGYHFGCHPHGYYSRYHYHRHRRVYAGTRCAGGFGILGGRVHHGGGHRRTKPYRARPAARRVGGHIGRSRIGA